MHTVFLWDAVNVALEYPSMGATCCVFDFTECGDMALHINSHHILYYHMDAYKSIMLGCSYF